MVRNGWVRCFSWRCSPINHLGQKTLLLSSKLPAFWRKDVSEPRGVKKSLEILAQWNQNTTCVSFRRLDIPCSSTENMTIDAWGMIFHSYIPQASFSLNFLVILDVRAFQWETYSFRRFLEKQNELNEKWSCIYKPKSSSKQIWNIYYILYEYYIYIYDGWDGWDGCVQRDLLQALLRSQRRVSQPLAFFHAAPSLV